MQHDHNDMDKRLRQLENQSLPDLTKQDEHWEDMKKQLQPGSRPRFGTALLKNRWKWLIAACIIGLLIITTYKWVLTPRHDSITSTEKRELAKPVNNVPGDTLPRPIKIDIKSPAKIILPYSKNRFSIIPSKIRWTIIPDTVKAGSMADTTINPSENSITLEKFFQQLEKPAQEFLVNNKRDTLLRGNNGSVFLIPADAFAGDQAIRIIVKEFYSYQDIITHRLSTSSQGNQLITGGMIHVSAEADGKEVNIQPGKSIRWYIPDTTASMKQMQLFTGVTSNKVNKQRPYDDVGMDTVSSSRFNGIDWIAQETLFQNNMNSVRVKVLDLRNEPLRVRKTSKGNIATFLIADKSNLSKDQLIAQLQEKYDYYKVKLKHKRKTWRVFPFLSFYRDIESSIVEAVGDSAWVTPDVAATYRLKATDTVITKNSNSGMIYGTFKKGGIQNSPEMKQLIKRFSVEVKDLGWINCDRFYKNSNPKIEFAIDLKDTASNYYTLLVFDKIKSMMTGFVSGNQVMFSNVPEGETARVISVGIQHGKPMYASKDVKISRTVINDLKFEETTPDAFRKETATFDN